MEGETSNEMVESQLANLTTRLMTLEAKVSLLNTTQEHGKKRLEEIQKFSENIITLQERKLAEIEQNAKEQKKLLAEMRIHLQNLQNSRVNHKDILVRHENQVKKLIELVNEISARQHELEMDKQWIEDANARRFSSFEGGRKTRHEDLYDFQDGGRHVSGKRSTSGASGRHHQHRAQSVPVRKERRRSSIRQTTSNI